MTASDEIDRAIKFLEWERDPGAFYRDIFGQTPYPYQRKVMLMTQEKKRIMLLAAGGTGKTKGIAATALYLCLVWSRKIKKPVSIIIISGSRDQARNLYEYITTAISQSPILTDMVEGNPTKSLTIFKNGSKIKAVANSLKAIQGQHHDIVLIDEAVLAGDFIIKDALRITIQSEIDKIILLGTPMNEEGGDLFLDMWEDKQTFSEWTRFHWSAMDCPLVTSEKIEEARKTYDPENFSIFIEGKPYPKIGALIPHDKLKFAVRDNKLFNYESNMGKVIAGLDWGWRDPTALVITQWSRDGSLVKVLFAEQWGFQDFEKELHPKIITLCKAYHVDRLYADAEDIGENQRLEAKGLPITPVGFNQNKVAMQTKLKLVFYQEKIRIPMDFQKLIKQLRVYSWDTKKNEDLVDALMLAVHEDVGYNSEYFHKIF